MTNVRPIDIDVINEIIEEGWEFVGQNDSGEFLFVRNFGNYTFSAEIWEDR